MTSQLSSLFAAMEILPDGLLIVDRQQRIVGCNGAAERLFGYAHGELVDQPLSVLLPPSVRKLHQRLVAAHDPTTQSRPMENRPVLSGISKSGKRLPVSIGISTIEAGDERYFVAVIRDARSFDDTLEKAMSLADIDPLTQLGNRRYLSSKLAERARSDEHSSLAVLFLDLDGFKRLNDEYGHETGDEVLGIVARRLRSSLREADVCVRLGGDEFLVLPAGVNEPGPLEAVARKLHRSITAAMRLGDRSLGIGVSIGGAIGSAGLARTGLLLEHADTAMYRAKQSRRAYSFHDAGRAAA